MDVTISYELAAEDYLESQMTYNRHSKSVRDGIKRSRISMFSMYLFLFLIAYPALRGIVRIAVLAAIALLGVAHIAFMGRLNEAWNRKTVKKMLANPDVQAIFGKKKLKLADGELTYIEKLRTTKIGIGSVSRILESDRHYLIVHDAEATIIVPKDIDGMSEKVGLLIGEIRKAIG